MVKALTRKLVRDLWHLKGQVLTIALVVSAGIAVLLGAISTYNTLEKAQQYYFKNYELADIFAFLKRAPNAIATRIADIPGVNRVDPRLVYDVTLQVRTFPEPAIGRFISIPRNHLPTINRLHLREGRFISPDANNNEIMVNEAFANAHHFKPGDTVTAVLNGKKQVLTIVGIVLSPEYVYAIRGVDVLPDNKHFGVFWMNYKSLANAFGMDGAFNSLTVKIAPGSPVQAIIDHIDTLLKPYGGLGAIDKSDQISTKFVTNELSELKFIASVIPSIFLLVAAFLLNIVTSRLVKIQRQQIATFKAVGYTDSQIGLHYLKFISVIIFLGSVLGILGGAWMGRAMIDLYKVYFYFPLFDYHLSVNVIVIGTLISYLAAISGTIGSLYTVLHLQPAIAMRPQAPVSYHANIFDRYFLKLFRSPATKMILRYIFRFPIRSLYTVIGVSLSVAVVMMGMFWKDSIMHIIQLEFMFSDRSDAVVSFEEPVSDTVLTELGNMPGVLSVEASRAVAVEFHSGHYSYKSGLTGLERGDGQRQVLDKNFHRFQIPDDSLLMSTELAKRLHVNVGDQVYIDVLQGKRPKFSLTLSGLIKDYLGLSAYTSLNHLNRKLQDGNVISSAMLLVDKNQIHTLYQRLNQLPKIGTIQLKSSLMAVFQDTFAKHIFVFTAFFTGFAILIAIGIVYNSARINLSERAWELATLRVLGFTRGEVSYLLLGGLGLELLVGIPLGWLIGYYLANFSVYMIPTELIRLPLMIDRLTYANSAAVTIIAGILSALLVRRKVRHLDLIAVLKTVE